MELFTALSLFRRQKYEECASICTDLLKKNPLDQVHVVPHRFFMDKCICEM